MKESGKVSVFIKKKKSSFRRLLLCVILLIVVQFSSAQHTKGWGAVGSVYLNSPYGNYIADVGVVHSWGLGKYLSVGAGMKYSYVHTGNLGEWYWESHRYVFNVDKSMMSLDGVGTINVYCPIVRNFGIYGNVLFTFDILPWDYVEVKKYSQDAPQTYETKSIYAFNNFAPRLFGGGGLYYDIKQANNTLRITLGYGCGRYDSFQGCRKKVYDGQVLGEHIPKAKVLHSLSLGFSVMY